MFTSFPTDSVMFLIHFFFFSSLIFCNFFFIRFPISLRHYRRVSFRLNFFFFPFRLHSVIHVVCTLHTHSHTNTRADINKRTLKQKKKQFLLLYEKRLNEHFTNMCQCLQHSATTILLRIRSNKGRQCSSRIGSLVT